MLNFQRSVNIIRMVLGMSIGSFVAGLATPLSADRSRISNFCNQAALQASYETGVPIDVLRAITLTETGRRGPGGFQPWPWTINVEGHGKWLEEFRKAADFAQMQYDRGFRSFDIGCFQLNYRWHGSAFETIDQMFIPLENARYAAKFLHNLYLEFGDWSTAAGAYHSRTPHLAKKYRAKFDKIRSSLSVLEIKNQDGRKVDTRDKPTTSVSVEGVASLPILTTSGTASLGSLVPLARNHFGEIVKSRNATSLFEY